MTEAAKRLVAAAGVFAIAAVTFTAIFLLPVRASDAAAPDKTAIEKIVHDYLLSHPELLQEISRALDAKQEAAEQKMRADALAGLGRKVLLDPKIAYVTGPSNAKVTLVEFFDYRCPHCKNSLGAMKKLTETNKTVRFACIEFPILTDDSTVAAHAALAARRQAGKYLPFHFALMGTTGPLPKDRILSIAKQAGLDTIRLEKDMADPAIADAIKQSIALAAKLHFNGTPTFVINDKIVVGEVTDDELVRFVNQAAG